MNGTTTELGHAVANTSLSTGLVMGVAAAIEISGMPARSMLPRIAIVVLLPVGPRMATTWS